MTSALTGSTTEPVIRNRMISVVAHRIASASGRWCAQRLLLVQERRASGRRPRRRTARGTARTSRTKSFARSPSAGPGATRSIAEPAGRPPASTTRPARGSRFAYALDLPPASRAPRRTPASPRSAGTRSAARRRRRAPTCRCGSTDASTPVKRICRNGRPSTISSTDANVANGDRAAHHALRVAVPEAAALGARLARRSRPSSARGRPR